MLDLRQIRNFVVVAEHLSVSRAAEVVHLSQPALSRQIQALERELGMMLFERIGKRLCLTVDGEALLRRSVALLDHADALVRRPVGQSEDTVGHLSIGATPQTIARLVSPAMAEFRRTHQLATFSIREADNDELLELVANGRVHLAIAAFAGQPGLAGVKLFQATLQAVVPRNHRFACERSVELADLGAEDVIVLRRGFLTRRLFDLACARTRVRPRIVLESDNAATLAALARDGHGVAIVSTSADIRDETVVVLPLCDGGQPLTGDVYALWNAVRHQPSHLPEFVRLLEHVGAKGVQKLKSAERDPAPAAVVP